MSAIPTEDLFYRDNINEALCHYRIALGNLENRPDYYDKENNMKENCRAGINTYAVEKLYQKVNHQNG